jgi:hypothetical protein
MLQEQPLFARRSYEESHEIGADNPPDHELDDRDIGPNFGTMPHAAIRLTGPQSSGRSFQQISWWMGV